MRESGAEDSFHDFLEINQRTTGTAFLVRRRSHMTLQAFRERTGDSDFQRSALIVFLYYCGWLGYFGSGKERRVTQENRKQKICSYNMIEMKFAVDFRIYSKLIIKEAQR
jgi:hypothetical protein